MSLRYRYWLSRSSCPILTLGGRWVRPQPLVGVNVVGPMGSRHIIGCLDCAADDTIFSEKLTAQLGIDLTGAPTGTARGVGMVPVPLRFAQITLQLSGGVEVREWRAWAGFTSARLSRPLFGFAGFLQYFTSTFWGDLEEFELTVNRLYPGT